MKIIIQKNFFDDKGTITYFAYAEGKQIGSIGYIDGGENSKAYLIKREGLKTIEFGAEQLMEKLNKKGYFPNQININTFNEPHLGHFRINNNEISNLVRSLNELGIVATAA